jgi:hypothetical protein
VGIKVYTVRDDPMQIIMELRDQYGRPTPNEKDENHRRFNAPWLPNDPIESYFDLLEDCYIFACRKFKSGTYVVSHGLGYFYLIVLTTLKSHNKAINKSNRLSVRSSNQFFRFLRHWSRSVLSPLTYFKVRVKGNPTDYQSHLKSKESSRAENQEEKPRSN